MVLYARPATGSGHVEYFEFNHLDTFRQALPGHVQLVNNHYDLQLTSYSITYLSYFTFYNLVSTHVHHARPGIKSPQQYIHPNNCPKQGDNCIEGPPYPESALLWTER